MNAARKIITRKIALLPAGLQPPRSSPGLYAYALCVCVRISVYRKCSTGEGVFMFDSKEADAIFEKVQKMSRLARTTLGNVSAVHQIIIGPHSIECTGAAF